MHAPNDMALLAEICAEIREVKEAVTQPPASPWLNTEQAAAYIRSTAATLKSWRRDGIGPPFHKYRRLVRYRRDELDDCLKRKGPRDHGPFSRGENSKEQSEKANA